MKPTASVLRDIITLPFEIIELQNLNKYELLQQIEFSNREVLNNTQNYHYIDDS